MELHIPAWKEPERPVVHGEFAHRTWYDFDPGFNLELLRDPRNSYPGHKLAAYAAWRSWLIVGDDSEAEDVIDDAICLSVADTLVGAEARAKRKYGRFVAQQSDALVMNVLARMVEISPYFYSEIYDPIGGMRTLRATTVRSAHRAKLKAAYMRLRYALILAQVIHFVSGQPNLDLPASVNLAAPLIARLRPFADDEPPRERAVRDYWSRWREQLPIAYAAASLHRPGVEESLLDELSFGRVGLSDFQTMLPQLLGRASYFVGSVAAKLSNRNIRPELGRHFPKTEEIPFEPLSFSDTQTGQILRAFTKSA